jgi:hypothetical protein
VSIHHPAAVSVAAESAAGDIDFGRYGVAVVLRKNWADIPRQAPELGIFELWREVLVVAEVFADQELEALRRFPEIGREELFRFFTLTPADVAGAVSGVAGADDPGAQGAGRVPAGAGVIWSTTRRCCCSGWRAST